VSVIRRPGAEDLRLIGWAVGRALAVLGAVMAVPMVVALATGDVNGASALGLGVALALGLALAGTRTRPRRALGWANGLVAVALSWLVGAFVAAVPLALSGRYDGLLAAGFDAMSALTTTGLSVAHDPDHAPTALILHLALLQLVGGLGTVVTVLVVLVGGGARSVALAAAAERGERTHPNVAHTLRFIARAATGYLVAGITVLVALLLADGFTPGRAVLNAVTLASSALATGGFTVMHTSLAHHHSPAVEAVVVALMLAGALSFGLHVALWSGRPREALRHLEVRTLAITTTSGLALVLAGLAGAGVHRDAVALVRRGALTLVAAATTTGLTVVDGGLLRSDWGALAPAALVAAMAVGGMTASTAGGIKAFRVGVVVKTIVADVRRALLPSSAVVVASYHAGRRRVLDEDLSRTATTVLILHLITYLVGGAVGLLTGAGDITDTLFESVSVTANAGLTLGVVGPGMPPLLMATHLVQMWLGRLEFVAVLALVAWSVALVRGRVER
jgi:trk system potassium uptake protein TrkH